MATFEEARVCPKCGKPGERTTEKTFPDKSKLITFFCRTELCSWFNTPWNVTIREDGTIPDAYSGVKHAKVYDGFQNDDALAKQLIESLTAMNEISIKDARK